MRIDGRGNDHGSFPTAGSDALLARRYEFKYLLHQELVQPIRHFIRPFVHPDRHLREPGGRSYPICSLYLDSPDLELCLRTLRGEKNRYKLRARTYSDEPRDPVFLEIKRRVDGMIIKRRCRVSRERGAALLSGAAPPRPGPEPEPPSETDAPSDPERHSEPEHPSELEEFLRLKAAGARPILRVKYRREAYEAEGPEPVRVTLDTDLFHAVTSTHDLSHNGYGWRRTPVEGTILEIKFTERYPSWIERLVHAFGLEKLSMAKYCQSVLCAVREGRYKAPQIAEIDSFQQGAA